MERLAPIAACSLCSLVYRPKCPRCCAPPEQRLPLLPPRLPAAVSEAFLRFADAHEKFWAIDDDTCDSEELADALRAVRYEEHELATAIRRAVVSGAVALADTALNAANAEVK